MIPKFIRSKILFGALIAAVVTIPLSNNLNSIALIVFVVSCIIQEPWSVMKGHVVRSKFWIIPVLFFIWYCCTYFWDVSGGFTNKEIERYTILLFLPLAFAVVPQLTWAMVRKACLAFVSVTVVVCIICLLKAYLEYRVTGDYRVFFYQYLGEQMHLNAIFLSNYCLASITWIFYFGYVERRNFRASHHILSVLIAMFLLFMIFMLSSKLIIFLALLILIVFILGLGYVRGFFLKALAVMVLLIGIGIVAVSNLHYLNWRINTTVIKTYEGSQDDNNGVAIRLFMWETTLNLIRERPVTGYGLRGGRIALLEEYKRKNFNLGVQGYYHSHNQYLESSLMAGIPATTLLILMIVAAFRRGITTRNLLLILMVSHFAIQSLFEATFEVQHELVFYLFFIFLFYYHAPQNNNVQQHL